MWLRSRVNTIDSFQFGQHATAETSIFDEVHTIGMVNGFPDLSASRQRVSVVVLSRHRHVRRASSWRTCVWRRFRCARWATLFSTYGAEIDYYVSGADVEVPDSPERNYSERLVLLPGLGVVHNKPMYKHRGLKNNTQDLVINCPYCQKLAYPYVQTLKKLLDCIKRPMKLRLLVGASTCRANDHLPFSNKA